MQRISVLSAAVVLFGACGSDAPVGWEGTMRDSADVVIVENPAWQEWAGAEPTLETRLTLGGADRNADERFGQIAAVDVGRDGTIYVLDQQAAQVRVYDSRGRFLRTIGAPGEGPGGLSASAAAVLVGAGDSVYVADLRRQRIHRFAPDGSAAGGVQVPIARGIPVSWNITPDHRFVTQLRLMELTGGPAGAPVAREEPRDLIVARNTRGEVVDTLLVLKSGRTFEFTGGMPAMRLFEPEPMWTVLSDGRLVHGSSDVYRLELMSPDGKVERVITKPFERRPVTDADRRALLDVLRASVTGRASPQGVEQFLSRVQIASHYPAYARLLGGPNGSIWVQHIRTAEVAAREGRDFDPQEIGAPEWDVFDRQGRLLGTLALPAGFQPLRIVGSDVYGAQRNAQGAQQLVKLRVDGL